VLHNEFPNFLGNFASANMPSVEQQTLVSSNRIENCRFNFSGETISPCPCKAPRIERKNGTSDPIGCAISASAFRDNFHFEELLSASSTGGGVAASAAQSGAMRNFLF